MRSERLIPVLFAVVSVLFYLPTLIGVRAFPDGDFAHHFFPFSLYQHEQLAAGQLAVWNPYTYGGHPFLADVQAAIYYPVSNLLTLVTLPVYDAAARFYLLEVEAVLHTAFTGWFAFLWARDLTGSRWGGLIGGVTWALSGFVTGYAPLQLAVLRTATWLPLLLWTLGRGVQSPRQWRWWMASAVVVSVAFLAGHSQTFLLMAYAAVAWTVTLVVENRPIQWRALMGAGVAALLAVGLTAAQWMPSAEFVRQSVRANVDYTFVSGGLAWADFWQLLLPRVLTQYSPLYVGVIGVVLVVIALLTLLRPSQAVKGVPARLVPWKVGVAFYVGLSIFGLLVALGDNGPLFPLLYSTAPGWSWFRGQERAALLVAIGLSALCAYGMAALAEVGPNVRRRAAVIAGVVIVGVVYAFGLLWQLAGRSALAHGGYLLIAAVTLALGMAAVVLVAMAHDGNRRNMWLVVLTVINLVWANAATNQLPGSPADRVRVAPEVDALVEAVASRDDVANGLPGRVYNEYRAYDDYGMRTHLEDVWGSSPLRAAHYAALFEQFPLDRMWRLLGVEHVLTWRRELFGPSDLLAEFPQESDTTYLHRLPTPNPRAWMVGNVTVVDDDRAWTLLADHDFDLDQNAVLGEEYVDFAAMETTDAVVGNVLMTRRGPGALHILVTSERDALLVVSETWLPGWEVAEVDCAIEACFGADKAGRRYFVPMRVNLTLVGVWVPAGESRFTLRYAPQSVTQGLWISGGSLLLVAVVALWRRWRREAQA